MMRHILSREGREVLAQMAWANVLLAFDYDGTLAPIVDDPPKAKMRRVTKNLLAKVSDRYPCTIISGRAHHDPALSFPEITLCALVGNHGLEPWRNPAEYETRVRRWTTLLEEQLGGLKGVQIEDKRLSLAIHYRASREKKVALAAIREAVAGLREARIVSGKLVVNVLPNGAPHKGIALQRVRDGQGCDTALYVGDDETDEDVFSLDQPGQLLGVRVGESRSSGAPYFLRDQSEIDELLRVLLAARRSRTDMRRTSDAPTA
jgi:trehalose 6-phosphate phosphatase